MDIKNIVSLLDSVAPFLDDRSVISAHGYAKIDATGVAAENGTFVAFRGADVAELGVKDSCVGVHSSVISALRGLAKTHESATVSLDADKLVVRDKKFETRLAVDVGAEMPVEIRTPVKRSGWVDIGDDVWDAVRAAAAYIDSSSNPHPVLMHVHCSKNGYVEGCDSVQAMRMPVEFPTPDRDVLLRSDSAFLCLSAQRVQYINDVSACFEVERGFRVWYRLPSAEYFDLTPQFDGADGNQLTFPRGVVQFLQDVLVMSDGAEHDGVRFRFGDGKLVAQWDGRLGSAEQSFRCSCEPMKFMASARRMLRCLDESGLDAILIPNRRIIFPGDRQIVLSLMAD